MAGKFERKSFAQIDINDPFFDALKQDYPEFETNWFPKGIRENREALVFSDDQGLGAFVAMKRENEAIHLRETTLPACDRLKISTLRLRKYLDFSHMQTSDDKLSQIILDRCLHVCSSALESLINNTPFEIPSKPDSSETYLLSFLYTSLLHAPATSVLSN